MKLPIREESATDVVVVSSLRTPFGRRGGGLSTAHALDLLGLVQRCAIERAGIDPAQVGQVVGGCVMQVGMQTFNVTRSAWLAAGLPITVPATTLDAQCGSSQQALTVAHGLVAGGIVDVALACGVEVMSRVPMGASVPLDPDAGKPLNRAYFTHHEFTSQFEGAERIAERWGISRADCDAFAKSSQDRAATAWDDGRFTSQTVPVPIGDRTVERDEGPRPTTLEGLAQLRSTGRPDGVHTAGSSSQISDGASAVLVMTRRRAAELGVAPLARLVDSVLVGCDPVLMLEGPIPATRTLLQRHGLAIRDLDVIEINEAFASVVLAWQREFEPDMNIVNPNGGAIALGHPLGATGCALVAKAVHELHRVDGDLALVTMCCGGGLGTGTLVQRERGRQG